MALKPPQPRVETYKAFVAPSYEGMYNTISLARPMRWLGAIPGGIADVFVLTRDEFGEDRPLSKELPSGALLPVIDLEQLEGQRRLEFGYARGGPSPKAEFIGPRLGFRPDELLAVPERMRDSTADEGQDWLAALEIIELPPHDESAGAGRTS